MEKAFEINRVFYYITVDILALIAIYYLPALSHLTTIPFYMFEPMRIVLFSLVLLAGNNKCNIYLMAVSLPLFASMVAGHPFFPKSVLMSSELVLNVWLLFFLSKHIKNTFFCVFLSIFVSKLFYYVIKFLLISIGVMNTGLVSTNLYTQIGVGVVIAITYSLVSLIRRR